MPGNSEQFHRPEEPDRSTSSEQHGWNRELSATPADQGAAVALDALSFSHAAEENSPFFQALDRATTILQYDLESRDVLQTDDPAMSQYFGLSRRAFQFAEFHGLPLEELESEPHPTGLDQALQDKRELLAQIVQYTRECWQRVKDKGHVVLADDPQQFLDLITQPHSYTVVLRSTASGAGDVIVTPDKDLEGYVLFNMNPPEFPDLEYIPQELLDQNPVRGLRAHMNGKGMLLGPYGEGLDLMMKAAFEICGDRPMITKVCVGPEGFAHRWAKYAFTRMGFEDTGHKVTHPVPLTDGQTVDLEFAWLQYPPRSSAGQKRQEAYLRKWQDLNVARHRKFADTTTRIEPIGQLVAHVSPGGTNDASDLGAFFPGNFIVGLWLTEGGKANYQPNVRHLAAPPQGVEFPVGSFDAVINDSTFPIIGLMGGGSEPEQSVRELLARQLEQTRLHGTIEFRERLLGDLPAEVVIEIPQNDGKETGAPHDLSLAALFELYAQTVNWPGEATSGVPFDRLPDASDGFARFQVNCAPAVSFAFNKEYASPADWERERDRSVLFRQLFVLSELQAQGARLIEAGPRRNPWVTRNYFQRQMRLSDTNGESLSYPAPMNMIVAEKVAPGEGVALYEVTRKPVDQASFLKLYRYRHRETGETREVIERPFPEAELSQQTAGILLWSEKADGQIEIRVKKGFPRPIINARRISPRLDDTVHGGYAVEEFAAAMEPDEDPDELVERILKEKAQLQPDDILGIGDPQRSLPSPGTTNELLQMYPVRIRPQEETIEAPNYSGFSDSGRISSMDLLQFLRSTVVGSSCSARLQRAGYDLLHSLGQHAGPWPGERITLEEQVRKSLQPESAADLFHRASPVGDWKQWLKDLDPVLMAAYFQIWEGTFRERVHGSNQTPERKLEYGQPAVDTGISDNTISIAPLIATSDGIDLLLEERTDLPVVQEVLGVPGISVIPAFRLPIDITNFDAAEEYVKEALYEQHGLRVKQLWQPGGRYTASSGAITEEVFPYAAEVESEVVFREDSPMRAVRMYDALRNRSLVLDGHTQTSLYWLAHQFSILE